MKKTKGKVSCYLNATDSKSQDYFEIDNVLDMIKHGYEPILTITQEVKLAFQKGKDVYNASKAKLPMFCASGEFRHRDGSIHNLISYSNMMVLDFDWTDPDPSVINDFKESLISRATALHLYAVWKSPSKGIKAILLHSNREPVYHTEMFYQVRDTLFKNESTWDNVCKDIARPCFISFDPDIFINTDPALEEFQFVHDPAYIHTTAAQLTKFSTPYPISHGQFTHTSEEQKTNFYLQKMLSDKTLLNRLKKIHDTENPDYYKDGNRHNEVKRRATLYCKDGILYENALASLKGQFGPNSRAGWPEDKIESIVKSCYNLARGDFGRDGTKFRVKNIIGITPFCN